MSFLRRSSLTGLLGVFLGTAFPSQAQSFNPRDELLRLVPEDFAVCLILSDLRGHMKRWEQPGWLTSFKQTPLGKAVAKAPELKELVRFQQELKSQLAIDWPTLRDDILGDAVVLAYKPGHEESREQGILLLQARRPELLTSLVDNLNRAQKVSGSLKALETRKHNGLEYVCRVETKENHFYFLRGPFLAFTSSEQVLKRVLEKHKTDMSVSSLIATQLKKAGADAAAINLWINPRALDAEIKQKISAISSFPPVSAFMDQWQALEGLLVSFTLQEQLDLRLTMLAREKDLPAWSRSFFMERAQTPDVWRRFPQTTVLRLAGRVDGKDLARVFTDAASADVQKTIKTAIQPLAAIAGIDLLKDLPAAFGPDWGVSLSPATDSSKLPHLIAALALQRGSKDLEVDRALYRAVGFFAGLALFEHNRRNPENPIELLTLQQDKVEVKYLANDKVFPRGLQPAWALKDGYLLLATSPEAIAGFRDLPKPTSTKEAPLLDFSATELAKILRQHRQSVIDRVLAKNTPSTTVAAQQLDGLLAILDSINHIEISRSSGDGLSTWILRISAPHKSGTD